MGGLIFIGIIILGFVISSILSKINDAISNKRKILELKKEDYDKKLSELRKSYEAKEEELKQHQLKVSEMENYQKSVLETLDELIKEKCSCYPHMAAIMADLLTVHYKQSAKYLETKQHPALTEAFRIKELQAETKSIIRELKYLEYTIKEIQHKNFSLDNATPYAAQLKKQADELTLEIEHLKEEIKKSTLKREELQEELHSINERNITLQETLGAWNKEAAAIYQIAKDNMPKAFMSDSLLDSYINSMKTTRINRALSEDIRFELPLNISATVHSESGEIYYTSITNCSCQDFARQHKPCKHMIALAIRAKVLTPYSNEIKEQIESMERKVMKISETEAFIKETRKQLGQRKEELDATQKIIDEKLQSYPWLASLIANYKAAKYDARVKSPVTKRELTAAIKRTEKEKALLTNQLAVYEYMFPILNAFKELPPQNLIANISESKTTGFNYNWLSEDDYKILTSAEKQQLWIKKYFEHRSKNAWEAGIKYERYIGYLCEKEGCNVKYTGALLKLNDMGRDLIATKGDTIYVIQCKRFSLNKEIHENHLFQLFGSPCHYSAEHPNKKVVGVFVSTTHLSDVAKECAKKLDILLYENIEFKEYPIIKCNIGKSGEKIYHLPFDQQYDNVTIRIGTDEQYVSTINEAEKLGFRHAMKHKFIS